MSRTSLVVVTVVVLLASAAIVVWSLFRIGPPSSKIPSSTLRSTPTPTPKPNLYVSQKYSYSIVFPHGWIQIRDTNIENLVAIARNLSDEQKQNFNAFLSPVDITFIDPRSDARFKARILVRVKPKSLTTTIAEDKQFLESTFKNLVYLVDEKTVFQNQEAHRIEATGELGSIGLHTQTLFFERNGLVFAITLATREEEWIKHRELFPQILATFSLN